ncbi:hypothetical protein AAZX31_06G083500 [Glycine max]|uniref:Uncharacterized protein n=2 Tax=Glycine subgen. Soja TaxID=1462606 RepID=I1K9F8_SOYBN|nr:uncharacterized protein LOC102666753 [Glycine max]XP_028235543.1 uncharacterized protein LOC114415168 [Glycine soja]KAG5018812.1 hypothetical protein JHK87_014667 [Glycine soja]KAG5031135.1 hypothetical protein JHK85_015117 [Glycine max]KAG5045361.1 hypothetical protein JHK86_014767 [Glycine max]KAG5147866.1 hypothetical protein JHK82_014747 [Glycine max]KAH1124857.1 hypothetical protein GYH30_014499 [Glycine max]|eukprot:XP_006581454.1 uncharacterized protein LOC102666753 [Glycine max]
MKPRADMHFPLPQHVADITCMDPNRPPLVAEKVFKTVRFIGFFIQNGVSKSKVVVHDMQDVMKRGKNIGKALNDVVARHHQALTCRPRDAHVAFVSPLEYQFSCSGSPPRLSSHAGRRNLSQASPAVRRSPAHRAVRMCRGGDGGADGTIHRRVKITGSAASMFNVDRAEKDFHVDEAAEEFIARFYRDLRLQKWLDHYC